MTQGLRSRDAKMKSKLTSKVLIIQDEPPLDIEKYLKECIDQKREEVGAGFSGQQFGFVPDMIKELNFQINIMRDLANKKNETLNPEA